MGEYHCVCRAEEEFIVVADNPGEAKGAAENRFRSDIIYLKKPIECECHEV